MKAIWTIAAILTLLVSAVPAVVIVGYANDKIALPERIALNSKPENAGEDIGDLSVDVSDSVIRLIPSQRLKELIRTTCHNAKSSTESYFKCANSILESVDEPPIEEPRSAIDREPLPVRDDGNAYGVFSITGSTIIVVSLILFQFMGVFDALRSTFSSSLLFDRFHAWCVDAPPILGICGTLIALISYLASIDGGDALDGFLGAFATAATTTLLGGITAVINQGLLSYARR